MSEPSCRVEGRDRKNYFSIHLRDFKGFSPAQGQEFQRHVVWPGCQSTFHSLSWEVYWPIVRTIRGLGIQGPESAPTDPVAQYIYPRPLLILKLNSRVWHKGWQHFQILTLALLQMQNLPQLPSWVDSSLRALGHRPGLPQTHSLSLMVLEVLTHPRTTVCTSAPVPSSSYPLTHDFKTLSFTDMYCPMIQVSDNYSSKETYWMTFSFKNGLWSSQARAKYSDEGRDTIFWGDLIKF